MVLLGNNDIYVINYALHFWKILATLAFFTLVRFVFKKCSLIGHACFSALFNNCKLLGGHMASIFLKLLVHTPFPDQHIKSRFLLNTGLLPTTFN